MVGQQVRDVRIEARDVRGQRVIRGDDREPGRRGRDDLEPRVDAHPLPVGIQRLVRVHVTEPRLVVLDLELQRTGWTLEELDCLADVLANTAPGTPPGWTGQAYDDLDAARITNAAAMNARYGPALLGELAEKLRQLGPAADIALVDAIRRWYDDSETRP